MPIVYLDGTAYRHLREAGIDPVATAIDKDSREHDDIEVVFDDVALLDLASSYRFGDPETGAELFRRVRQVASERILKHFGWLVRDEVRALLEMIPRYWWHYEDEDADKIRRLIDDLLRGEWDVSAELEVRDRLSRQEAFGRVLHYLFKESSFDAEGIEDFEGLLVRYGKENRREYLRKLLGEVVRVEKPGEVARRVELKLIRCPTVAAFTKLPLLKQYLYKMRYEDRRRSDEEEMIHLCSLAHVDVLVSQSEKFRERFQLLYPDKGAYDLEAFLASVETQK